ncbi:MAG: NAD(P)H:quinone oxidoreductase [Kangiellaceae bacterium]
MTKILILYYSSGGKTKQLAHLIARGVEETGAEAVLRTAPRISTNTEKVENEVPTVGDCYASLNDLANCDGLIIGSPSRFGNMAAPLKYFIDQTSEIWMNGKLSGKPVSCFTSASSLHGGQEAVLLSMMIPFLHHGMIICGLPYSEVSLLHTTSGGTPYGVSHWSGNTNDHPLSEEEKQMAKAQGNRTARLSARLKD